MTDKPNLDEAPVPAETTLQKNAPDTPEPESSTVRRIQKDLEAGDFAMARKTALHSQDDNLPQEELAALARRLAPDSAAYIAAVAIGLVLVVTAACTLFH
jgi:hypothetical protein